MGNVHNYGTYTSFGTEELSFCAIRLWNFAGVLGILLLLCSVHKIKPKKQATNTTLCVSFQPLTSLNFRVLGK
jgi:hypothetical protein